MIGQPSQALLERANGACELCTRHDDLAAHSVAHAPVQFEASIYLCGTCLGQVNGDVELDSKHWFCLQESIWSEVPAVQVVGYRLLDSLRQNSWAADLLESVYLEPEILEWAESGLGVSVSDVAKTVDCNGTPLADGDAITLTRGLDVKGTNFTAKQGTLVKKIRLSDDPDWIEGRVNGVVIYIKTCYIKRA